MKTSGVLAVLCCLATPAAADPIDSLAALSPHFTLIDFESVATEGNLVTSLPNPFTIGDVTFTSLTGNLSILDITVSGWEADGTEVSSNTLFPGGEPDSAISIVFAHPAAQFLLGWGDPNFSGNVLQAFSASGVLLEEAHPGLNPPGGGFATWIGFSRHTADIARIVVQPDQSLPFGDDYVIDNIRYYTHPVPEPGTWLLIAVGSSGVWLFANRGRALKALPMNKAAVISVHTVQGVRDLRHFRQPVGQRHHLREHELLGHPTHD